jgi:transcriptional regulator with XRE-family HTH domain
MSFNYSKLRGKIIEKFGTQGNFAKVLGVSERTLSLKLNNKLFFSQDELAKISELLNIDSDKIQIYFFQKEVQYIEL